MAKPAKAPTIEQAQAAIKANHHGAIPHESSTESLKITKTARMKHNYVLEVTKALSRIKAIVADPRMDANAKFKAIIKLRGEINDYSRAIRDAYDSERRYHRSTFYKKVESKVSACVAAIEDEWSEKAKAQREAEREVQKLEGMAADMGAKPTADQVKAFADQAEAFVESFAKANGSKPAVHTPEGQQIAAIRAYTETMNKQPADAKYAADEIARLAKLLSPLPDRSPRRDALPASAIPKGRDGRNTNSPHAT